MPHADIVIDGSVRGEVGKLAAHDPYKPKFPFDFQMYL